MNKPLIERDPLVYVHATKRGDYGHLYAYFRFYPTEYSDRVEILLSSQIGTGSWAGSGDRSNDSQMKDIYAVEFKVEEVPFKFIDYAAKLAKKYERTVEKRTEYSNVPSDGIGRFMANLECAISAWGIDTGAIYDGPTGRGDYRNLGELPRYNDLKRSGFSAFAQAVLTQYHTHLLPQFAR